MELDQTQANNQNDLLSLILKAIDLKAEAPAEQASLVFINDFPLAEISAAFESLPEQYRHILWAVLTESMYWDLLHQLNYETARHIIGSFSREQLQPLLNLAEDMDIVTFAELLPCDFVDNYISEQEESNTALLQSALSYSDEEVGRYISLDITRTLPSASVGQVTERLRKQAKKTASIFVVDRAKQFCGVLSLTALFEAPQQDKVSQHLLSSEVLNDTDDISEVAQRITPSPGLAWLPVQKNGTIIGALPLSLLLSRLRDKSLEVLGAETPQDEEDLFTPVFSAAKMRAVWLVANLLTAFLASAVIALFESTVEQVVALAILMPVVASMGGIGGSQTLAIALRGIALNHLQKSNLPLLIHKEVKIALVNGLVLGLLISVVVGYWFSSPLLGLIIGIAIVFNSLAAGFSGTVIPFILKRMKIDPAIAGSVILTTVTDIVGFFIFLGLGSWWLI